MGPNIVQQKIIHVGHIWNGRYLISLSGVHVDYFTLGCSKKY